MNKLLHQQLDELLGTTPGRSGLKFESALRVGAGTLCRADWSQITATTVVCDVADYEVESFRSLVAEIADDYGLEASIRNNAGSYAVRFALPPVLETREKPSRSVKGLLARIIARSTVANEKG